MYLWSIFRITCNYIQIVIPSKPDQNIQKCHKSVQFSRLIRDSKYDRDLLCLSCIFFAHTHLGEECVRGIHEITEEVFRFLHFQILMILLYLSG